MFSEMEISRSYPARAYSHLEKLKRMLGIFVKLENIAFASLKSLY